MNSDSQFSARFATIRTRLMTLLHLYVEKGKLTLAEKLTLLLSAGIILFVCALLCVIGLVFLSGSLLSLLAMCMSDVAAWAIMGGIYMCLALLLVVLRKPLVINPVARFVSRLIVGDDVDDAPPHDALANNNVSGK